MYLFIFAVYRADVEFMCFFKLDIGEDCAVSAKSELGGLQDTVQTST